MSAVVAAVNFLQMGIKHRFVDGFQEISGQKWRRHINDPAKWVIRFTYTN